MQEPCKILVVVIFIVVVLCVDNKLAQMISSKIWIHKFLMRFLKKFLTLSINEKCDLNEKLLTNGLLSRVLHMLHVSGHVNFWVEVSHWIWAQSSKFSFSQFVKIFKQTQDSLSKSVSNGQEILVSHFDVTQMKSKFICTKLNKYFIIIISF